MSLRCVAPRAWAALVAVTSAAGLFTASAPAEAAPSPPPCPASVVPGVPALPGAVGCWNAIAVQTARRANVFPIGGLIAVSAPQLAVYDAVTEIAGRYARYHAFSPPPGTEVAGASVDASVAAAAHTTLAAAYPAQAAGPTGLDAQYAGYIAALRADGRPGIDAGVAIGDASARDLLAFRAGDRDESITVVPPPLSPGTWTFAPAPSVQSAQTPWVATMRPFTLASPSQFRPAPPPPLSSDRWAEEFNETKAYGSATSSVRTPQQTAVARFWNAHGVNQYNQAFQDVAAARGMDAVDTARVLAMGNVIGADAGIACWDAKYHYRFWRPVMAIRNAGIDGNPATVADPTWTPLLTTPNHPEYPAAHGCLTGSEAEVLATVTGPERSGFTIRGSAGGTVDDWTAVQRFGRSDDLQEQIVNARVWAGLHYRGSVRAGVQVGTDVARWTLGRYFAPAPARDCGRHDGHPNTGGRS
jgi:hypothetical protein